MSERKWADKSEVQGFAIGYKQPTQQLQRVKKWEYNTMMMQRANHAKEVVNNGDLLRFVYF